MSVPLPSTIRTSHPYKDLKSLRFITSPKGELQSVILSIEEFQNLIETASFETKTDLLESIDRARQQLREGQPLMTFEEVFGGNL